MLCLFTVGLLWLQAAVFFLIGYQPTFTGSFVDGLLQTLFVFLVTAIAWLVFYKPFLKNKKALLDRNFKLSRFRNNPEIFETLLKQQSFVDTTPFEYDLQLGDKDASLQLIVVANPYCEPCAKAHEQMHSVLERKNIGLTVRFAIEADDNEDRRTKAVEYIFQCIPCEEENNPVYKRQLIYDWFRYMDLEKFSAVYKRINNKDVKPLLKQQERWDQESKIEATPTVFVNGIKLPDQYGTEGISSVIDFWKPLNETKHLYY